MSNTKKQKAISEIAEIVKKYDITIKELSLALKQEYKEKSKNDSSIIQRIFTYFGGIFLFAGITIFIGTHWNDMNLAGQLIVTLGAGFVSFIMAVMCLTQEKFEKASTPLFLIAAFLETSGLGALLDEFSSSNNIHHGIIFISVVMLLQHGLTFFIKKRTILAFISIVYLYVLYSTLLDMVRVDGNYIAAIIGASMLCVGYSVNKSIHISLSPFIYFFGAIMLFIGSFDILHEASFEILYLGITAALIYLSVAVKSRTLLFISCAAMLCYIGYYTNEHFLNSLGWVMTLIILGLVMLGLGSFAFKLDKRIKSG